MMCLHRARLELARPSSLLVLMLMLYVLAGALDMRPPVQSADVAPSCTTHRTPLILPVPMPSAAPGRPIQIEVTRAIH